MLSNVLSYVTTKLLYYVTLEYRCQMPKKSHGLCHTNPLQRQMFNGTIEKPGKHCPLKRDWMPKFTWTV